VNHRFERVLFVLVAIQVATGGHRAKIFSPTAFLHPRSIMSCHPQTPQSPSQFSPNTSDLMMSMTGSAASTTTTLPTPAHSINGSSIPSEMTHDTVMGEDSPHKRKRDVSDTGDRAQKKVHVEDRNSGINDLHLDVGEKYLLCRTRKAPFYLSATAAAAGVTTPLFPWRVWFPACCSMVLYGMRAWGFS
jgi:hypothetical protein